MLYEVITASSIAQWLQPDSIYTIKLTKRGIRYDQGKDLDIMQGVMVGEVMNHTPITMHKNQTVAELFAAFQETVITSYSIHYTKLYDPKNPLRRALSATAEA